MLKNKILEITGGEYKSISKIWRALRDQGVEMPRNALAGYLRALRDLDVVDELDAPPSKLYKQR